MKTNPGSLDKDTIILMLENLLEVCKQSPELLLYTYELDRGVNEIPNDIGYVTRVPDSQTFVKLSMSYFTK